ncbi:NADPH-dependent F420 reductase [Arthrobacter ginsengisoli]|uniref:NADPH-dependent F420 reductase n=1 Tax=Arthrobacter ginsengisoli TaxID=1356565 RepID=A0ABU1UI15_9MICC|nr:NADPH-dependent F420 reductase [Arthrobacter ginsengisoli]MDR7084819.1 NADPH-dependent F420 reductase [Arthrobacter ginsengisoli]
MTESVIAVLGGTGPQGKGLAYRFAKAGRRVILGSRDARRAAEAAHELDERVGGGGLVTGATNPEATSQASLVVVAVPWDGHDELIGSLRAELVEKIVVSCVNPIGFDKRGPFGLPMADSSAAEHLQSIVPEARVVAAFHHVSAGNLIGPAEKLDHEDVLVAGDDKDATEAVRELAATVTGRPGIDAGALRLARQLEPLTAVLISINKKYKTRAGVTISGLPEA